MFRNARLLDSDVETIESKYGKQLDEGTRPIRSMSVVISDAEGFDVNDVEEYIKTREKKEKSDLKPREEEEDLIEDEAGLLPGSGIEGFLRSALRSKYTGPDRSKELIKGINELYDWEKKGSSDNTYVHEIIKEISKNLVLVLCSKVGERGGKTFSDAGELRDTITSISGRLNHLFGTNHVLPSKGEDKVYSTLMLSHQTKVMDEIQSKIEKISEKFDGVIKSFDPSDGEMVRNVAILIENFMVQLAKLKSVIHEIKHTKDRLDFFAEGGKKDEVQESINTFRGGKERVNQKDFRKTMKHFLNSGFGTEEQRKEMQSIIEEIDKDKPKGITFGTIEDKIEEAKKDHKEYSLNSLLGGADAGKPLNYGTQFTYFINGEKKVLNLGNKLASIIYPSIRNRADKEGEERAQAILGEIEFRSFISDFKKHIESHVSTNKDKLNQDNIRKSIPIRVNELFNVLIDNSYSVPMDKIKDEKQRNLARVLSGLDKLSKTKMDLLSIIGEKVLKIVPRDGKDTLLVNVEEGDDYAKLAEERIMELIKNYHTMVEKSESESEFHPLNFVLKRGEKSILVDRDFLGLELDMMADKMLRAKGKTTDSIRSLERAEQKQVSDKLKGAVEVDTYYKLEEKGKKKLNQIRGSVFEYIKNELGKEPSSSDEAVKLLKKKGNSPNDGTVGGGHLRSAILCSAAEEIFGENGKPGIPKKHLNKDQLSLVEKFKKIGDEVVYEEDGEVRDVPDVVSPVQEAIRDTGDILKEVGDHLAKFGIKMSDKTKAEVKRDFIQSADAGVPRDTFVAGYVKSHIRNILNWFSKRDLPPGSLPPGSLPPGSYLEDLGSEEDILGISSYIDKIIDGIEIEFNQKYPPGDDTGGSDTEGLVTRKDIKGWVFLRLKKGISSDPGQSIDDIARLLKNKDVIKSTVGLVMDQSGLIPSVAKTAMKLANRYLSKVMGKN